jgi:hypothetical protein
VTAAITRQAKVNRESKGLELSLNMKNLRQKVDTLEKLLIYSVFKVNPG